MMRVSCLALGLVLVLAVTPSLGLDIDRKTVWIHSVEPPLINIRAVDLETVRVDWAFGAVHIGEPELRTTKSWCVPRGSDNQIRDAVEIPTHYYEVPYRATEGVLVVRDGSGTALHSARLEPLESSHRFGYDQCRYWLPDPLKEDFARQHSSFEASVREQAAAYFERLAEAELDDTVFFKVLKEKVPLYRFKDKRHDYSDLQQAFELARRGYEGGHAGRPDLEQAVSIWERALTESDVNDKKSRINRKVSVKLFESIGTAQLVLGDHEAAVDWLDKSKRYGSMTVSRSSGTGSQDLMDRARERRARYRMNPDLPPEPNDLQALIESVEHFRGKIALEQRPSAELASLMAEHGNRSVDGFVEAYEAALEEHEAKVAAGLANPYENKVGRTAMQGFYLFLMPYPEKLSEFPEQVCELTHLNQLRIPNHGFDTVPESIGNLAGLRLLDLSGNNITRLPDSIASLKQLKTLKLKGNPLAAGEVERLRALLPGCKVKG